MVTVPNEAGPQRVHAISAAECVKQTHPHTGKLASSWVPGPNGPGSKLKDLPEQVNDPDSYNLV